MKYNPILQGAISFMHRSKKLHGKSRTFPPFSGSNILLSLQSMHLSLLLVPPPS
jgi:hypothetical protein